MAKRDPARPLIKAGNGVKLPAEGGALSGERATISYFVPRAKRLAQAEGRTVVVPVSG